MRGEAGEPREVQTVPSPPFPRGPRHPTGHQPRPHPANGARTPGLLPWARKWCPLSGDRPSPPTSGRPPSTQLRRRSRGDRAVPAVSLREVRGGGNRDRARDGEGEPGGRGPEFEGGAKGGGWRGGAPGQAGPSGREGRAHLVTVRRARGLCALSRPRRTPMPVSTSSAATPHTA